MFSTELEPLFSFHFVEQINWNKPTDDLFPSGSNHPLLAPSEQSSIEMNEYLERSMTIWIYVY